MTDSQNYVDFLNTLFKKITIIKVGKCKMIEKLTLR